MTLKKSNIRRLIGLNIAYYRKLNGMTQEQLGSELNMEQSSISKIERAARGVSIDTLYDIAEELGVEAYQLLKPKD